MNLPELRTPCPLEACEAEPTTGMPLDVVHEATRAGTVRETRTAGAPSVSSIPPPESTAYDGHPAAGPVLAAASPDLSEARRFLSLLDPDTENFTFQTFTERKDRPKPDPLAEVKHGRFDELASWLIKQNRAGAGIFVAVNETDGRGRRKENIVRIRALWQECDRGDEPTLPLEPHLTVETSPGRFHRYILVRGVPLHEFEGVQQRLVDDYGSDPSAKDRARVLRLPGFYHCKNPTSPQMVRVAAESRDPPLPWTDVVTALPPVVRTKLASVLPTSADDPPLNIREVVSALACIDPDIGYGDWIRIGMALHSTGGGAEALEIWESWSAKGSRYKPGECSYRWSTFRGGKTFSLSIKTLFGIARTNGWRSPSAERERGSSGKPLAVAEESSGGSTGTLASSGVPIAPPGLRPMELSDFLKTPFPPRTNLLAPWLPMQGLCMAFAPRGIGKTYFGLSVAYAVASGCPFLGWEAPEPAGVLYLDGEMPAIVMQERLAAIAKHAGVPRPAPFTILTPDLQVEGMPRIDTPEGQAAIDAILTPDHKLIVVDNISTLTGAKENEADAWTPVQDWALRQRARGRSVLFIHHAGKGGTQRGTSRREDVLDTVLRLCRPADYSPEEGAVFEVHFEKSRGIYGEDVASIEVRLNTDPTTGDMEWTTRSVEASTYERVVALSEDGLNPSEIATELNIHKSTVSRHLKKAKAAGVLSRPKK
jgi:hypothetical protein